MLDPLAEVGGVMRKPKIGMNVSVLYSDERGIALSNYVPVLAIEDRRDQLGRPSRPVVTVEVAGRRRQVQWHPDFVLIEGGARSKA